jgi:formylglycine-generating enzyme required for sulfatase activity
MKKEMKNPVADVKKEENIYTMRKESFRTQRGGSWNNRHPTHFCVSYRHYFVQPFEGGDDIGFRIVRNQK